MKDYKVELKIKNGYLSSMMDSHDIKNVAELSRLTGIHQTPLGEILNLKKSAYNANGALRKHVARLCDYFLCEVYDIFPPDHINEPLRQSKFDAYVNRDQIHQIEQAARDPYLLVSESELSFDDMVNSDKLTDRQKKILKMRFVDDLTLEQIGAKFNLSKERIRSIEAKAVRQLRWPRHSDKLRVFIEG
jgi:hypothetical protein